MSKSYSELYTENAQLKTNMEAMNEALVIIKKKDIASKITLEKLIKTLKAANARMERLIEVRNGFRREIFEQNKEIDSLSVDKKALKWQVKDLQSGLRIEMRCRRELSVKVDSLTADNKALVADRRRQDDGDMAFKAANELLKANEAALRQELAIVSAGLLETISRLKLQIAELLQELKDERDFTAIFLALPDVNVEAYVNSLQQANVRLLDEITRLRKEIDRLVRAHNKDIMDNL